MNIVWSRFLRSLYRKEPITGFLITVGAVDAAIGGLGEHWSLFAFGTGTIAVAIALRWWQQHRQATLEQTHRAPVHILPPQTSSSALPSLTMPKKQSPRRL